MRTLLASALVSLLFYGARTAKRYPEPSLISTTYSAIRNMHLDGSNVTIMRSTSGCIGADYVYKADRLFWIQLKWIKTDVGKRNLIRLQGDESGPQNIAVDWIYNNFYWVDNVNNTLQIANFDGYRRQVLIRDMHEPYGIALAPMNGWMFWTNSDNNSASIEKAGMDGTQRRIIISKNIKRPMALTIDFARGHLYWNDAVLFTISSCDYNGNDFRQILHSPKKLEQTRGIDIFEDWVFWSSVGKLSIFKYNIVNKGGIKSLFTVEQHPRAVRIYHRTKQPDGENHCLNVKCSHLCVPAPMMNDSSPKFSCICPKRLQIFSDGLTCVYPVAHRDVYAVKPYTEPSLIFSTWKKLRNIHLDGTNVTIVSRVGGCYALDYLHRADMLFWIDFKTKGIRTDVGNRTLIELKGAEIGPLNIAVDWIYNNLYWVGDYKNTLEVANINGSRRQVLIKDMHQPIGIALVPMNGWMFWTNSDIKSPSIEKAGMDGTQRRIIISKNILWPVDLTVDLTRERLYWNDWTLKTISSCDYNGNDVQQILHSREELKLPSGIDIFEDWVFWGSRPEGSLFKYNIVNKGGIQTLFTGKSKNLASMSIRIYDKNKQPDGKNHCLNVKCSHLCVPAPMVNDSSPKFSCICPENFNLDRDGLTCLPE